MNIILCETAEKEKYNAGNKARKDVLEIALGCGYIHVPLFHNGKSKCIIVIEMIHACFRILLGTRRGDMILIQYPYRPLAVNRILFSVLKIGKKIRKYKIMLLIHDLLSLRSEDDGMAEAVKMEVSDMSGIDTIICHNQAMRRILCQNNPGFHYEMLGVFDYLTSQTAKEHPYHAGPPEVVIAGNLSPDKSGYVYGLNEIKGIQFHLYGADYVFKESDHVTYKGRYSSDDLIQHIEGNFGLVWDGDSIETCRGATGVYLKYNNPHKFSMYIAAGLPVIVWNQSENKVGICVSTLLELPDALKKIDENRYKEMKDCVMKARSGIISGKNLKGILEAG